MIVVEGLRLVPPDDVPTLAHMLRNLWRLKELWNDETLHNPGQWFMSQYANENNLVFDVEDGAGVIAFLHTHRGFRASIWVAAWDRRAFRQRDLWRTAARVAMLAHDLLVVDAYVRTDNALGRRAALAAGMTYRGRIRLAGCYNGHAYPLDWYEGDRRAVGLDPIEGDF